MQGNVSNDRENFRRMTPSWSFCSCHYSSKATLLLRIFWFGFLVVTSITWKKCINFLFLAHRKDFPHNILFPLFATFLILSTQVFICISTNSFLWTQTAFIHRQHVCLSKTIKAHHKNITEIHMWVQHLTKEHVSMANKHTSRHSTSSANEETRPESTTSPHYTPIRASKMLKMAHAKRRWRYEATGTLTHHWWESKMAQLWSSNHFWQSCPTLPF